MKAWHKLVDARLQRPESQRQLVLIIVSIAMLLDNMLYMVIVPIIPDYLRALEVLDKREDLLANLSTNLHFANYTRQNPGRKSHFTWLVREQEDAKVGVLFACKAIVQLIFNPLSGFVIDRIG